MNAKKILLTVLVGFVVIAFLQCQNKEGATSKEEIKALGDRFVQAWDKGDWLVLDELLADDFVFHVAVPGLTPDRDGYKRFFDMHHTAFPDFQATVEDVIVEGDKIMHRMKWSGTHKGEFMGIAPTDKQVTLSLITIERVANGKIAEQWGEADMLGLMQQLGVVSSPGEAGE
jgi:steroid delta-isomerase-like uncharacterized protein